VSINLPGAPSGDPIGAGALPTELSGTPGGPAAAGTSANNEGERPKRAYPAPSGLPTQPGPNGLRFDFNDGARVFCPESQIRWMVRLRDIDTGNILFETEFLGGRVNSSKRYYVRFRVEVWCQDEIVLSHDYSAKDRRVLIQFPVGTLGDTMGWFPYAIKFKEQHGCRLTCAMGEKLIGLFRDAYPDIDFVTHEQVEAEDFYATYSIGLFFDDKDFVFQPSDFRQVGLHRTAGYILGVDPTESPPRIAIPNDARPIAEPYVCIATQSTTQSKYWNNPAGWRELVSFLKEAGYRVICIDQKPTHGHELVWNHLPHGCEDDTGDKPLVDRARLLKHAAFFVGLSSGLSWLAWAVGTPIVMISGFTHPTNEFHTPYRVINYHACNSCWNDVRVRFDHQDFFWCPRYKGTPRQFECTRLITVDQVKQTIQKIPDFAVQSATYSSVDG
jgi:autotransporter strand-loop-strand O-heptosyltransferase